GGGRFEAALGSAESDALLAELPRLEAAGELRVASRERRGIATPSDAGALALSRRIKQALDPAGGLLWRARSTSSTRPRSTRARSTACTAGSACRPAPPTRCSGSRPIRRAAAST